MKLSPVYIVVVGLVLLVLGAFIGGGVGGLFILFGLPMSIIGIMRVLKGKGS